MCILVCSPSFNLFIRNAIFENSDICVKSLYIFNVAVDYGRMHLIINVK